MCPPGFDIGLGGTPCDAEGQFCALEACGACQSCSLLGCANHIWAGVTLEPNAATCKGGMLATDPATCTPGAPGCYPEAPLGWSGPYLLKSAASTEPEPECPADWGSESLLSTGGTKSSVECSCACGEPQGVVCEATSVTLQSCSANGTGRTVSTQCADFGNNGFTSININAKVILPGPSGGSCGGAGALTQKKTERTFESRTRQCSVAKGCPVGGSCGTGVDPGDGWTACVTASFPFNCPAAYPSARVLQLVGEDTLACGACSDCQAACGGTVSLYNEKSPSTCASAPVSVIGAGCAPTGFVNTARFDPAPPTCSSSSSPTGDPGVGPDRYFCCLP